MKNNNILKIILRIFGIILVLISLVITLILTIKNNNMYFGISFILCAIVLFYFIYDTGSEIKNIDKDEKEKYFKELSLKYDGLIKLIEVKANSHIKNLKQKDIDYALLSYKTSLKWIINYDKNLNFIKANRINGNPDTFIEAACLIKALTENFYISIDYDDRIEDYQKQLIYHKIIFLINLDIALEAAFEMIATPFIYTKNSKGCWTKTRLQAVDIDIPEGIIEKSPLHDRIINSFYKDYMNNESISIMQLSNMLHLIYLYCKDTKK